MSPVPRKAVIGKKRTVAEAADAAEMRSGKSARIVSLNAFQDLTGYDRGIVSRWIKTKNCPQNGKGAKGAIEVDVRAVIEWLIEQARIEERRKFADVETDPDADLDAELKREQIIATKVRTAEKTGLVILAAFMEETWALAFNPVRQSVMGLPSIVERILVGFPEGHVRQAKNDMTAQCRATLRQAEDGVQAAIRKATRKRLIEAGAEPDPEFDVIEGDLDDEAADDE